MTDVIKIFLLKSRLARMRQDSTLLELSRSNRAKQAGLFESIRNFFFIKLPKRAREDGVYLSVSKVYPSDKDQAMEKYASDILTGRAAGHNLRKRSPYYRNFKRR